ncbi:cytochrome c [Motiliproteus sp. SC1-56]|uniref:c-type cytochrome n=1 Tax=Motiliproteus sp. SC1-56 TaxID=2799565 RepID=UPI001A8DC665|nr:cytochrome c [Motiliproteus sp. SC1-56]
MDLPVSGKKALSLALGLSLFTSGLAVAAEFDGKSQIKLRQGFMQTQKRQLVKLTAVAKGEAEFNDAAVQRAANMRNLALIIPDVFEVPSGLDQFEGTRALPKIWQQPDEVKKRIRRLRAETARLVEVALEKDPEALAQQLKRVGGACKNCHDNFRKPLKKP